MALMTVASEMVASDPVPRASRPVMLRPGLSRPLLLLAIAAAAGFGFLAVDAHMTAQAVANAGADLTRLLRAMAMIKTAMAACAVAAVFWRLGGPVSLPWFAAYALSAGAMAMGPSLIWTMAYVGTGAILLHGGLLGTILLVWRDPRVASELADLVQARRLKLSGAPKLQA